VPSNQTEERRNAAQKFADAHSTADQIGDHDLQLAVKSVCYLAEGLGALLRDLDDDVWWTKAAINGTGDLPGEPLTTAIADLATIVDGLQPTQGEERRRGLF
jgi:hypothetical protein